VQALILFRPALKPGKGKQGQRNNQRDKRVRHVNVVGAGFKPGDEGGKAARWNEHVEGGERQEHEAKNAGDQGERLCHAALSSRAPRRRQEPRTSGHWRAARNSFLAAACAGAQRLSGRTVVVEDVGPHHRASRSPFHEAMTPFGVARRLTRLEPSGFVDGGAYIPDASSLSNWVRASPATPPFAGAVSFVSRGSGAICGLVGGAWTVGEVSAAASLRLSVPSVGPGR
jgi:hypothetical protein